MAAIGAVESRRSLKRLKKLAKAFLAANYFYIEAEKRPKRKKIATIFEKKTIEPISRFEGKRQLKINQEKPNARKVENPASV